MECNVLGCLGWNFIPKKKRPAEKHQTEFASGDHLSGQNISTSHDLTPNGGLVREIPLFQGNLGW